MGTAAGRNVLGDGQYGLHGDVHNHHALGAQMEGQDLECVGDQQAREANVVKDAKDPDEDELGVAGLDIELVAVLEDGARDGPAHERHDHADHGDQE